MPFNTRELTDRAQQLQAAYDAAYASHRTRGPGPFGIDGPARRAPDVTHIYDDFLVLPDPASFVDATDGLRAAMLRLAPSGSTEDPNDTGTPDLTLANPHLQAIGTAGQYLEDWTGDAAQQFVSSYASRFVPVTTDQYAVAAMVRSAINAEAAIWQAVRDDLDHLSAEAIDHMRHATDCSLTTWASVLGIAAAIVAAPFTGGTSLEIGLGSVAAGVSVAGTGISAAAGGGDDDTRDLPTHGPDDVAQAVRDRLADLRTRIRDQEQRIADTLTRNHDAIAAQWDRVLLPAPALASATAGDVAGEALGGHDAG